MLPTSSHMVLLLSGLGITLWEALMSNVGQTWVPLPALPLAWPLKSDFILQTAVSSAIKWAQLTALLYRLSEIMHANFSSQRLEFDNHFINVSKLLIFYCPSWKNIACKLFSAVTSWGGEPNRANTRAE